MISALFQVLDPTKVVQAERELTQAGITHLYLVEESELERILIGGLAQQSVFKQTLRYSILVEEKPASEIDWGDQWELFAQDFRDGVSHIDLHPFGNSSPLLLQPGPGFGDLSHPTTHLVLELMSGMMTNDTVLDLGCGSGILTLAALKLGAQTAIGIDIDPEALQHARANNDLNRLDARFFSAVPPNFSASIALMNMIFPEQRAVLTQLNLIPKIPRWITSGILLEQRAEYLDFSAQQGWQIVETRERDGWLGFSFQTIVDSRSLSRS